MTVLRERSQSTKYTGSDATAIADAVRLFFAALHDLLSVVIGKAGFLTKIPFIGPPITSVLRSVEGVVDVSGWCSRLCSLAAWTNLFCG